MTKSKVVVKKNKSEKEKIELLRECALSNINEATAFLMFVEREIALNDYKLCVKVNIDITPKSEERRISKAWDAELEEMTKDVFCVYTRNGIKGKNWIQSFQYFNSKAPAYEYIKELPTALEHKVMSLYDAKRKLKIL